MWTWQGDGRPAGPAAAGDCEGLEVGLGQVRQALVHAWLPPQLQVHTHSARSPA